MGIEFGTELEGVWTGDPDVLRLQEILKKHGIDHSGQTIWNTWGDYCQACHLASWLDTKGYSETYLFTGYWGYFCGLIRDWESNDVLIDIVERIEKAGKA